MPQEIYDEATANPRYRLCSWCHEKLVTGDTVVRQKNQPARYHVVCAQDRIKALTESEHCPVVNKRALRSSGERVIRKGDGL